MAKEYNVGDRLYLPVWITDKETNIMMGPDNSTMITDANFAYTYFLGQTKTGKVRYGEEGLLLTAEEVADNIDLIARETLEEYREGAVRRIQELEVECEKWKATAQNCENSAKAADNAADNLRLENKKLMAAVDKLKDTLSDRTKDVQHLTEENDKLKTELDQRNKDFWAMKKDRDELDSIGGKLRAENDNLKEWYEEANRTASEAAEANDDLKAKIADLRNRVGEQLAQIQDLNAEIHDLKEERDLKAKLAQEWHDNAHSTAKGLDELKGRYDELDSVNKEQAEKIRKLDKALTDLKKRNDDLQAENTNLTFLLEDAPEKETTKTLHVVLNDGTEIEFRRYTAYDYRTDIKMFVVKDGERFIAGFNRGDKSFNFAYWWTE